MPISRPRRCAAAGRFHLHLTTRSVFGILTVCISACTGAAQTFGPGLGGDIPDGEGNVTFLTSTITVSGLGPGAQLDRVSLAIEHLWVGDVVAILTAPNGENVHLFSRLGATPSAVLGDSSNLSLAAGPYVFAETGASFLDAAIAAPGTNSVIPGGLYAVSTTAGGFDRPPADPDTFAAFAGDDLNGVWTLTLQDWILQSPGQLEEWTVSFVPSPGPAALLLVCGVAMLRRGVRRR